MEDGTAGERVSLRVYAQLLGRYLKPYKLRVALLALCVFSGIGMNLLNPQIVRHFIDTAREGGAVSELTQAALLFLAIGIVRQFVYLAGSYLGRGCGVASDQHDAGRSRRALPAIWICRSITSARPARW